MARSASRKIIKPPIDTRYIYSETEFAAILRYERARVDRSGESFSLVALEIGRSRYRAGEVKKLVQSLQERIRTTDQLGWLEEGTLGILLPGTNLEGAWSFVVEFEREYFGEQPPAPFTAYCYPEHWLHEDNGSDSSKKHSSRRGNSDILDFQFVSRKVETTFAGSLPGWKRILDVAVSLLGIVVSTPILLLLSLYIKLVSPGPVFFKQQRVGYKGKLFDFYKFRTMHTSNNFGCHQKHLKELINSDKPMEKLDEVRDPRIFWGGAVIRKTCIDELPQLFNVLKGDMSLVGPRPCLPYEAEEYLRWHTNRFDIHPGITGLWQVSGKNKLTFKQMIRLDIAYRQHRSLWLDLKILLLTFPAIVKFVMEAVVRRIKRVKESTDALAKKEPVSICQVLEYFAERS